mmetsp:Transcript_9243/g.16743  ORF Transcript_9243/g.16743 Transcript_9243/m.16743 type:complete len:270 (+) Transcript_9243:1894-2703(+)
MVEPKEITAAVDQLLLLLRECGQPAARRVPHRLGVLSLATPNGLGVEIKREIHSPIAGVDIVSVARDRLPPLGVQRDADDSLLLPLELLSVTLDRISVSEEKMVRGEVYLRPRVVGPSRSVHAEAEAQHADAAWLVERDPLLHAITKELEAFFAVRGEVLDELLAQHPAVLVLQGLGQVPVVQSRKGLDAVLQQFVDQAVVKVHALHVHVLDVASGEHPRPRQGEPVILHPQIRHQLHVLLHPVVMVTNNVAVVAIYDVSGNVRECVPN